MLEGTLQNVLEQKTLKWIFVGGKGGVGKTTTSCALSLLLSQRRQSVLLISTDPAHNLSDAFGCQFSSEPSLVPGTANLYAMEIDPNQGLSEMGLGDGEQNEGAEARSPLMAMMGELSGALPGIDEAMGFAQVMKLIQNMQYDVIVFDTAPTGHTLRFLSFPGVLEKALGSLSDLASGSMGAVFSQMSTLMGMPPAQMGQMTTKLRELSQVVQKVNQQFRDDSLTTFICVAIAEFLSLYETERLIQELLGYGIDTHNIVVNQLLFPDERPSESCPRCDYCQARWKIQCKYLGQMDDLYGEDFYLCKVPMLAKEVRGVGALLEFSHNLLAERQQ